MARTGRAGSITKVLGGLTAGLVILGAIAPAQAQRVSDPNRSNRDRSQQGSVAERIEIQRAPTILEAVDEAFYDHDKDFMDNRSLGRNLAWMFGFGFTDNEIVKDAEAFDDLYQDLMRQQNTSDPILRTRDLPNPYNTSVRELRNSGGL